MWASFVDPSIVRQNTPQDADDSGSRMVPVFPRVNSLGDIVGRLSRAPYGLRKPMPQARESRVLKIAEGSCRLFHAVNSTAILSNPSFSWSLGRLRSDLLACGAPIFGLAAFPRVMTRGGMLHSLAGIPRVI